MSRVCLSSLLMGIFIVASSVSESEAHETSEGSVLVLRQGKCCAKTAWARGEEALLEEFKTLDLTLQTLEIPEQITGDVEQTLLEYADKYETDVVLMITGAPPQNVAADILIKSRDGTISFRQMQFDGGREKQPLANLTLRVTEAVRAELIPVPPQRVPLPPPLPSTETGNDIAEVPITKEPEPKRLSLAIGAGTAWSPGGVGPSLVLTGNVAVRVFSWLYVEADGSWAGLTKDVKNADGAASFETLLFRGSLYWEFHLGKRVHPALGIGAGVAVVSTGGDVGADAAADAAAKEDRDTLTYLGVASRTRFEITDFFGILLALRAGALLPRADVYFGSERVASYGLPLLEGSVLLNFRFL